MQRVEVDVLVCGMGPVSSCGSKVVVNTSLTIFQTGLGAAKRLNQIVR